MSNKPLQYVLRLRKLRVKGKDGKEVKEEMQVAVPTGRHRVDFRSFCKAVSNNTTFSPEEVHAVLNMSIATARNIGGTTKAIPVTVFATMQKLHFLRRFPMQMRWLGMPQRVILTGTTMVIA